MGGLSNGSGLWKVTGLWGGTTGLSGGAGLVNEGGAGAAPNIAITALQYGALSISGVDTDGAILPETYNTGAPITSVNVNSSSTNFFTGTPHFTISSNGTIKITAAGDSANLSNSPYSANITFNSVGGTVTVDITVTAVANAYSVSSAVDMTAIMQRTSAQGFQYGQSVLVRYGGVYADQYIARSAVPGGLFAAPTFYSTGIPDLPEHLGINPSTGTFVWVDKHSSEPTPTLGRIRFNSNLNLACEGFMFRNLIMQKTDAPPSIGSPDADDFIFSLSGNQHRWVVLYNCTLTGNPNGVGNYDCYGGFWDNTAVNTYIVSQDCTYRYLWTGVNWNARPADRHYMIGNYFDTIWTDCALVNWCSNSQLNWNFSINKKSAYVYVGSSLHNDFIQIRQAGGTVPDATSNSVGTCIIGNVTCRGVGTATDGAPDANGYNGEDHQGIFIQQPFPFQNEGWRVEFNLITEVITNGITLNDGINSFIRSNSVFYHDPGNYNPPVGFGTVQLRIWLNGTGSGNTVQYNAVNQAIVDGTPGPNTINNNAVIARASYSTELVGAAAIQGGLNTNPVATFAISTGSAAYAASPRQGSAGTGYVNYSTRSITAPWYSVPSADTTAVTADTTNYKADGQ